MDKEEIEDYLKRVDELWDKLTGEDEETYAWLIYGYNKCAKLLNETKQQCKKQKEVIDKIIEIINYYGVDKEYNDNAILRHILKDMLDILKEVSE